MDVSSERQCLGQGIGGARSTPRLPAGNPPFPFGAIGRTIFVLQARFPLTQRRTNGKVSNRPPGEDALVRVIFENKQSVLSNQHSAKESSLNPTPIGA
jgi:hypothetical protein